MTCEVCCSCHSEQLSEEASSTSSEGIDFDQFNESTSGHSTATMMLDEEDDECNF